MSSPSFRIDLTEVRTAALTIRRAVDDLDLATRALEAAVQRVTAAHYGTDPLGRALQGEGSGVGGLPQHQEKVLQGIRHYLRNSSRLSDNLLLMCERHAENDAETAALLRRIHRGEPERPAVAAAAQTAAEPLPADGPGPALPRPRIGTVVTDAPLPDAAPEPPDAPEPDLVDYQDPGQPDLHYNDRAGTHRADADADRPVHGGGGAHPSLA
ncbi:hypothetical protein LO771_17850 [Streptacidiphilus sp. ASG 303]|uniref:hypothetical protein n=1 Tax=Streptacidiphilus sp. ASG 303 TaxID=2896847 RepID=UPI001E2BB4DD|nr:hypothetical protein [Streptacidiphilus sp. ASG 303]MCD0484206.1 hypothetical protein [Streptacidiphilus sp. ASG 303]